MLKNCQSDELLGHDCIAPFNSTIQIAINGSNIEKVNSTKYLGNIIYKYNTYIVYIIYNIYNIYIYIIYI